jgi:hypothetical protein
VTPDSDLMKELRNQLEEVMYIYQHRKQGALYTALMSLLRDDFVPIECANRRIYRNSQRKTDDLVLKNVKLDDATIWARLAESRGPLSGLIWDEREQALAFVIGSARLAIGMLYSPQENTGITRNMPFYKSAEEIRGQRDGGRLYTAISHALPRGQEYDRELDNVARLLEIDRERTKEEDRVILERVLMFRNGISDKIFWFALFGVGAVVALYIVRELQRRGPGPGPDPTGGGSTPDRGRQEPKPTSRYVPPPRLQPTTIALILSASALQELAAQGVQPGQTEPLPQAVTNRLLDAATFFLCIPAEEAEGLEQSLHLEPIDDFSAEPNIYVRLTTRGNADLFEQTTKYSIKNRLKEPGAAPCTWVKAECVVDTTGMERFHRV